MANPLGLGGAAGVVVRDGAAGPCPLLEEVDRAIGRLAAVALAVLSSCTASTRSPDSAPNSSTNQTAAVGASDIPVRADEQLAVDVVSAAGRLGWELQLSDLISGQSLAVVDGVEHAEARFDGPDTTGQVVVEITTGMSSATVANETSSRAGPFAAVGDARIYVATDSATVRAVELFEGSTLVYVESQLWPHAKSLDELQSLAISVAGAWPGHNVTVDPTITAAVPLAAAGP